jgi:hypothetical protein
MEKVIKAFAQLGKLMTHLGEVHQWENFECGVTEVEYETLLRVINKQFVLNGWFTKENVFQSLSSLGRQLTYDKLQDWIQPYHLSENIKPKRIAIIMAGNIPLVGFHDFLSVLITGNTAICKLSSDDKTLLPALAFHLIEFEPSLKEHIVFTDGRLGQFDAIIATGSDNSIQHFEQYFGHLPHIFRKNRTSIAVLTGNETNKELASLGKDIFDYFGLGCRNIAHLLVPKDYNFATFFESIVDFHPIINHHKYANNYDYNKAVYLMNKANLLDNNFVLLRETDELFSPLAMIHHHSYENHQEINNYLESNKEKIQVIIGKNYTAFGQAQCPMLNDYADGVDTIQWLSKI